MKRASSLFAVGLTAAALGAMPSCTTDREGAESAATPARTSQAHDELVALRRRFPALATTLLRAPAPEGPVAAPRVHVELPTTSQGDTLVEDTPSGLAVRVRLEGRPRSARVDVDGLAVYPGSGIVLRADGSGAEDLVSFDTRPTAEEAIYTLTPVGAAGLRLVGRSIELLDASGAPRVRMDAPYVIDAAGARVDASVAIEGCAYDTNPAAPWGRPVTAPGASHCTLRLAWHVATYPALLDPAWVTTGSGVAVDSQTVVKLANGKVLGFYGNSCGGGCLPSNQASIYDPATKTWAGTGGPQAKAYGIPAVLLGNGKVLSLTPVGAQIYDPALGTFADGPLQVVQRSGGASLTRLASGKILCAGGGGAAASTSAELYDPATNTFTATPAMKAAHSTHAAVLLASGKVLLAGGPDKSAEIYDPVANTFTLTGSMSFDRASSEGFKLASGKVLIVGGNQQAELYDPATGVFTKTGSFALPRTSTASVLMPSGNVYVTGGFIGTQATALVERYDPASGVFSPAPTMVKARGEHRATLLDSSTLLVTGGNIDTSSTSSQGLSEELGPVAAGGACAIDDDCAFGKCDVGVCCAATCTGTCMSCAAGSGACLPVKSADDPSSCTGASTCDASGSCKSKQGRTCKADAECASGFCTDGVCCDRGCNGVCEACDGAVPGLCETVAGKPHTGRTCATDGSACGGACDGKVASACAFPGTQTGCGTSCADGIRMAGACDGKGACTQQGAKPCPGNYACADSTTCRVTCANNAECGHGYGCTAGKCTPIAACDGDHTVVGADQKSKTDCSPFRCTNDTNVCRTSCEDVNGCTEPFLCDPSGQCVAPPSAASGCAVGPVNPGSRDGAGALAALVLALSVARRRRSGLG